MSRHPDQTDDPFLGASAAYGLFAGRRQDMVAAFVAWLQADHPDEEQIAQEVEATTNSLRRLADLHLEVARRG